MTGPDQSSDPSSSATAATAPRKRAGLTGMVLADLRTLAGQVGVGDVAGMRKGDLVAAIKERQGAGTDPAVASAPASAPAANRAPTGAPVVETPAKAPEPEPTSGPTPPATEAPPRRTRQRRGASRPTGSPEEQESAPAPQAPEAPAPSGDDAPDHRSPEGGTQDTRPPEAVPPSTGDDERPSRRERQGRRERGTQNAGNQGSSNLSTGSQDFGSQGTGSQGTGSQGTGSQGTGNQGTGNQGAGNQSAGNQDDPQITGPQGAGRDTDDDGEGRGRRGGRRFRERGRRRERGANEAEPVSQSSNHVREDRDDEVRDDDVLQPVAGILDVLDNYAFVRTSGYLAGTNDVYVSMNLVRRNGLRRGDAVTGAVRVPREGEQPSSRQKFNPLVRIDSINGGDAEAAKRRPEFAKLTPLYPNDRLRLETTPNVLTTRVIDLVMPIGKGQRALIVSPPKAGKTRVLQAIANAIAVNNPECHLMVVLIDERPEEVTDMQRSVKGEVIASTFDRPPSDHTAVAELAIERAKRLVESGTDVVVLLDSITRLGRAYNNSSPASGRILSGGVDSTALYPPKRFLGAARNIEEGGSLTILATALVETGSTGDTVIFEEFKGTGNAELKLDRKIAERRVFPAVDVNPSSTRKDELLMSADEYAVTVKLRRVLAGLDSAQAIDVLIDRLRKSGSNAEFLVQVSKTASAGIAARDEG